MSNEINVPCQVEHVHNLTRYVDRVKFHGIWR